MKTMPLHAHIPFSVDRSIGGNGPTTGLVLYYTLCTKKKSERTSRRSFFRRRAATSFPGGNWYTSHGYTFINAASNTKARRSMCVVRFGLNCLVAGVSVLYVWNCLYYTAGHICVHNALLAEAADKFKVRSPLINFVNYATRWMCAFNGRVRACLGVRFLYMWSWLPWGRSLEIKGNAENFFFFHLRDTDDWIIWKKRKRLFWFSVEFWLGFDDVY